MELKNMQLLNDIFIKKHINNVKDMVIYIKSIPSDVTHLSIIFLH